MVSRQPPAAALAASAAVALHEHRKFVLFNTLLLYTAGFCRLPADSASLPLSLLATAVLLMLVLLHGNVATHLGVGHPMWIASFLLLGADLFPLFEFSG